MFLAHPLGPILLQPLPHLRRITTITSTSTQKVYSLRERILRNLSLLTMTKPGCRRYQMLLSIWRLTMLTMPLCPLLVTPCLLLRPSSQPYYRLLQLNPFLRR